ncbi:hypothetical protein V8E54_000710 [Elaphomyces granulatus]
MATTCLLPKKSIEDNLANLLSYAWPNSSEISAQEYSAKSMTGTGPKGVGEYKQDAIRLFYLGKMTTDSIAFFPRLVVTLIYCASFLTHFCYVWNVSLTWLTKVAAGSVWSLLERANFAVVEGHKLHDHTPGRPIQFNSIDKASEEHMTTADIPMDDSTNLDGEARKELAAALRTMETTQKIERDTARQAARDALDRVIANAMILMSITVSTGFSAWTSAQVTGNTPNNFASSQLGSLALLASLALGAATMFASALQLSVLEASFRAILSLKEVRINGLAVEHYKKRQARYQRVSLIDGRLPQARLRCVGGQQGRGVHRSRVSWPGTWAAS